jgi:patatin-related protein
MQMRRSGSGYATGKWTEEVRLAMAWNGGVSLAVWMGGVAVELDSARRARLPPPPDEDPAAAPPDTPKSARDTGSLYGALCSAFDRVLVIDILTGASAGGLNCAFLAGVIVHRRQLTPKFLRDRWLDIGSFAKLLRPIGDKQPPSLMQGELFHRELVSAFKELLQTGGPPSGEGQAPVLLDVQATDVHGTQRVFVDDWNQEMYAREFRAPMKFRKLKEYTAGTLAAAARASASFPAAFEPQRLTGTAVRLASSPGEVRWAIDGGLLENAPIRPAIELVPTRRARRPVRRFVCYVNAAPTPHEEEPEEPGGPPTLAQVLSYTFNLPRVGREIDQLEAIAQAKHGAGLTARSGLELLHAGRRSLQASARALLPTYRKRRAELSLSELLAGPGVPSGPGLAEQVLEGLEGRPERLPWIPTSVSPPDEPQDWRWGIRTAQRILRLELDVLEAALERSDSAGDADVVFEAREHIDDALEVLDELYEDFVRPEGMVWLDAHRLASDLNAKRLLEEAPRLVDGLDSAGGRSALVDQLAVISQALRSDELVYSAVDLAVAVHAGLEAGKVRAALRTLTDRLAEEIAAGLGRLTARERGNGVTVGSVLFPATKAFYRALRRLSNEARARAAVPPLPKLFGPTAVMPQLQPGGYQHFLSIALAIEVIRRAFSDEFPLEAAQPLRVAQLTPRTPSPLFTAQPLAESGPSTGEDKLTGIRLVHFAGFYRASWRANDFFWGRLDGAARTVQFLVDADRARARARHGAKPWQRLAQSLVPTGDDPCDPDRRKLLEEVVPELEGVANRDRSVELLASALEADLAAGDGRITNVLFARALQYEIMREELPSLVAQAEVDRKLGALKTSLGWRTEPPFWDVIEDLREWRGDRALPRRLGRDHPDEATSAFSLRTIGHAALVGLSAVAGVVPLGRALQPARLPLLTFVGMAAQRLLDRLAVAAGFAGAVWYPAARWLTINPSADPDKPAGQIPLQAVWSDQVLALWVSLLVVAAVALVPLIRAMRTQSWWRRAMNGAVFLAIAASVGVALGWQWAKYGTIEALTTWHSTFAAPTELLWIVVVAGGIHGAAGVGNIVRAADSFQQLLAWVPSKPLGWLGAHAQRWASSWVSTTAVVLGALGGVLAAYSVTHIYPVWDHWGWKTAVATVALGAPVLLAVYLKVWSGALRTEAAEPASTSSTKV